MQSSTAERLFAGTSQAHEENRAKTSFLLSAATHVSRVLVGYGTSALAVRDRVTRNDSEDEVGVGV